MSVYWTTIFYPLPIPASPILRLLGERTQLVWDIWSHSAVAGQTAAQDVSRVRAAGQHDSPGRKALSVLFHIQELTDASDAARKSNATHSTELSFL